MAHDGSRASMRRLTVARAYQFVSWHRELQCVDMSVFIMTKAAKRFAHTQC